VPLLSIVELLKPPSGLLPLFLDVGRDKNQLYTVAEARQALSEYIAKHNLTSNEEKQSIVVDQLLAGVFLKSTSNAGSVVTKKELNEKFIGKLQSYYEININGETEIRKGEIKSVQILVEQRQGKKHVTRVSGLETFGIVPSALSSEFSKLFAASTTIQQLPGKNAGEEILVQGNVLKGVSDYLTDKLCIPKKYIEVLDKSLTKKKG